MNDNQWIIDNLSNALSTWNEKLSEIWELIATTPENFRGGGIWQVIVGINGALQAIGYGLLILFFAMGLFKSTAGFQDFKRPEMILRHFIRFVAAKTAVTYGMDLMNTIFSLCMGVVSTIAGRMGSVSGAMAELPGEISAAISDVGFLASIPLWLVTLLGSIFITVLSFVLILTVYARFFRLYMYTALAPIPLATFAGEPSQGTGKAFIKSYFGVCLQGAVIVLACIIFSAFASSPSVVEGEAVTMVWAYLGEIVFSMLVLVGLVKGSDRIVKEMLDL